MVMENSTENVDAFKSYGKSVSMGKTRWDLTSFDYCLSLAYTVLILLGRNGFALKLIMHLNVSSETYIFPDSETLIIEAMKWDVS